MNSDEGEMTMDLLALFHKGGLVMYPIVLASIISVAIAVERILFYNRSEGKMELLEEELPKALQTRNTQEAQAICERAGGVGSAVVDLAIKSRTGSLKACDVVEGIAIREASKLRQYLNYLEVIVTLSPLLGLLGTVVGMIGSFSVLSVSEGQPFAITGGVGEALVATASGLLVAILALVIHTYLVHRVDGLVSDIEYASSLYITHTNAGESYEA